MARADLVGWLGSEARAISSRVCHCTRYRSEYPFRSTWLIRVYRVFPPCSFHHHAGSNGVEQPYSLILTFISVPGSRRASFGDDGSTARPPVASHSEQAFPD